MLIDYLLLNGDGRHLWFLPVLFGCFIVMYLCRELINRYLGYTLLATIAAWSLYFKFPLLVPVLPAVLYYMVFFYLGYMTIHNIDKFGFIKSWWFIITSFVPIALLCRYTDHVIIKFILNIVGIFFSFGLGWRLSSIIKCSKLTKSLSRNLFGIYLFHPLLIYLAFFWMIEFELPVNLCMFVPALIVIVIFLSVLLTELLRYLKLGVMIGESSK